MIKRRCLRRSPEGTPVPATAVVDVVLGDRKEGREVQLCFPEHGKKSLDREFINGLQGITGASDLVPLARQALFLGRPAWLRCAVRR